MSHAPVIVWFRRDLRLQDHAALSAAVATGRPVLPVFVLDEVADTHGAAPRWRLGLGVENLQNSLTRLGSRLILRKGRALDCLKSLIAETGASAVYWHRAYDPAAIARDTEVKAALKSNGVDVQSFPGHVLFEPWTVQTGQGGYYKVYSAFARSVMSRDVAMPAPVPDHLKSPVQWPSSDTLSAWNLSRAMRRGADVVGQHVAVGEAVAQGRLQAFLDTKIHNYAGARDLPGVEGTSRLSENLTYGEISPQLCWHSGWRAREEGAAGAETFLKELLWRDFAYHLLYHTPHIASDNWRESWNSFPWKTDENAAHVLAWKQGRTGIPFVDAAMRELYVTGYMHNRGRMIVASYLTKHLMTHWKIGMNWFAEHLIDWDPASNAMGWQWSAGSGPDAAPYFRVFNPVSQLAKFDPKGVYPRRWIAEGAARPSDTALQFFDAIPASWDLSPNARYPDPIVSPGEGRERALASYAANK